MTDDRRTSSAGLAQHVAEVSRRSAAELTAEVPDEGMEPDGLFRELRLVLDIELAPALGLTEVDPVRRLVAGSTKARGLDEGLDQDRMISVALLPVVSEPPSRHAQKPGGKVAAVNPGQDEESGVVDHKMEPALALRGGPADEAVARRRLPRRGAESKQGENPVVGSGKVSQLRTWERLVAQVMIAVDVLVPPVRVCAVGDEFEVEVRQRPSGGEDREQVGFRLWCAAAIGPAVVVAIARRWEPHQPVVLHPQHGDTAAHVFEPSIGPAPSQLLAEESGQGGTACAWVLDHEAPDGLELRQSELTPAVAHLAAHQPIACLGASRPGDARACCRISSLSRGMLSRPTTRSWRYFQNEIPSLRQVFFRLAKVSRHRRPGSLRVQPLILRFLTYSRMSRSLKLLCNGISG